MEQKKGVSLNVIANVMICSLDQAAPYAYDGLFYDLKTIFTENELSAYSDRFISFEFPDLCQKTTDTKKTVCGVSISKNSNSTTYGAFIIKGTDDLNHSKKIFLDIINSDSNHI